MKLDGIKVLDLSAFLPGPHMTMMMADHGADVIMVEPANGTGEPTREIGQKTKDGITVWFRNIGRGKRSVALNLKDPADHAIFMELAAEADVVVEAFRPGVVKRLGVDYDAVRAINPGVVYCSISAFGQTGKYAHKPAHDMTVQALAGLVDLNRGLTDEKPASPNMPVADMAASLMALSGVLMALLRRTTTGKGDYVDLSMFDAAFAWTPNVTGPVFAEDRHPPVKEMRSFGGSAMYHIYETADARFLVLGGSEIKFAENLLTALGRPDLLPFAKMPPGPAQEPLRAFFRDTFATRSLPEWQEFLRGVDCCWAPVRSLKDAFDDPYVAERGMVLTDADGYRHIGVPIRFTDEPAQPRFELPLFGNKSARWQRALPAA
ncbi:CaiB/BaiF CoA transferase family protein [Niveispirillum cyanobacteriorum]|uniref:CoA transferase n=1 Tax=Niveispirillum cyanobacteriorum TaxID=1612173 RepID=A0A2K9NGC4_9PROT|nr:CoA transferase [Niveispirillum cyanobacteriorum]AUN32158.1 CoA transferase [Niveispirillum cyanobacteriorum]GGE74781.1 CoA transferase [Niveispirillum cyanobacteriorum]